MSENTSRFRLIVCEDEDRSLTLEENVERAMLEEDARWVPSALLGPVEYVDPAEVVARMREMSRRNAWLAALDRRRQRGLALYRDPPDGAA